MTSILPYSRGKLPLFEVFRGLRSVKISAEGCPWLRHSIDY